jgi:hypothetical protein
MIMEFHKLNFTLVLTVCCTMQSVIGGSVVFTTIDHPIMRDMRCNSSSSNSNNNDSNDTAASNSSTSNSNTNNTNASNSNSEDQEVEVLPSGVLIEADVSTSASETPNSVTRSRVTVVINWDCKGALQRCVNIGISM